MAKQKGIIKLEGKIGDLSFYKSKDGYLAREKGGVDGERIKKDPAFVRTRENGSEFGGSAKSGKLLRDAIRTMMQNASDNRVTSRVTKLMSQIKNLDTTSVRGERNVGVAIAGATAKALLKNFNFNDKAILGSILFNPFDVDLGTGVITLNNLIPVNDLNNAPGATHITLRGGWVKIDFTTGDYELQESNAVNLPIDATSTNVILTPAGAPSGSGTDIYLLMVEFYQEVNGDQYTLKNGAYNALAIIEVQ